MAKIIPEKVMYFNASYGEKKVYDSLKNFRMIIQCFILLHGNKRIE